jgi:hypothetical protein
VAAVEQKDAKIICYFQTQFYRNVNARKENLSMALIDYQKAFDRVPHSSVIKSLELIGINN